MPTNKPMNTISFHVPVLGSCYTMMPEFLRFYIGDNHITFYCHKNGLTRTTLYQIRSHHSTVLKFMEDTPLLPFAVEKINKKKSILSFENTYPNIKKLLHLLRTLFPDTAVSLDIMVYNDHYFFGRCALHPVDLYEMGYMSLVHAVALSPFYRQTQVFTGLLLVARNPFQKYMYDFVELCFFHNDKDKFLRMSFNMMLHDRPSAQTKLDLLLHNILTTIPLKEDVRATMSHDWKHYHDLEIKLSDFQLPLRKWQPGLFLTHLSKLLDMFPDYVIDTRFNLYFSTVED